MFKYNMSLFVRFILAFSLTSLGLVASANSSQANIVSSGYSLTTSARFVKYGNTLINVFVTNNGATGNVATCSVTIGYYLGAAYIASTRDTVRDAWIPIGNTITFEVDFPEELTPYSFKLDSANCTSSPNNFIENPEDRSLAYIPSDSSQLEFELLPTRGGDIWGIKITNRSQYPIYTKFEMAVNGGSTKNSETFKCEATYENGWQSGLSRIKRIGSYKYIEVYPQATNSITHIESPSGITTTRSEYSTTCELLFEFGSPFYSSVATYSPITIFSLQPAPPPAAAPAAAPTQLTLPAKKKYAAKALASQLGVIMVSPKAKVSFKVAGSSKKICAKSGSKLKTLKAGNCVVTFTVQEPKPKKGKKPKATKTVKTLIVQ